MALSSTEKKEIETLIRKEIREFLNSQTVKQFENRMMDEVAKEIKKGKLEGEVKELIVRGMVEFYQFMWTQRGSWEPRIRRA
jgi:NADPH-dependent curcumin reductase CurA